MRFALMLCLLLVIPKLWQIRALTTLDVRSHALRRRYGLLICILVLLEAPFDPIRRQMNSVLLTIDLTKAVADEAIERKDCVVVSYRRSFSPYASYLGNYF